MVSTELLAAQSENVMSDLTPTASIITIVLNAATTIERTIQSVLSQTYGQIEYVIVDGGSTDGTLDIIHHYRSGITKCISLPDKGIYDAFNKGVRLATGTYVAFVNADDWIAPDHIEIAIKLMEAHREKAFIYGDLLLYQSGKPIYLSKGSSDYQRSFRYAMGKLNHPSMVCRHSFFDTIGLFNTNYRVSGDFNWLQRLHKAGYCGIYTDQICANVEFGGISDHFCLLGLRENRISSISVGMNPLTCWLMYFIFLCRFHIRKLMERFMPAWAVLLLRQRIFRSVEIIDEKSRYRVEVHSADLSRRTDGV